MENGKRIGETNLKEMMNVVSFYQQDAKKVHAKKRVKPSFARFKLKFYWKDLRYTDLNKNGQVMYSYDYFYSYATGQKMKVENEKEGLCDLLREIDKQTLSDSFISVMIWACVDEEKNTLKSKYNIPIYKKVRNSKRWFNPSIKFVNDVLNVHSLVYVAPPVSDRIKAAAIG